MKASTDLSSVGVDAVDDGLDLLFEHSVCGRVSNHQGSLSVFKGVCVGVKRSYTENDRMKSHKQMKDE